MHRTEPNMERETSIVTLLAQIAVVLVLICLIIAPRAWWRRGNIACDRFDPLDQVLLRWTANDPLTVRDLLNGGISILGRVGSGKTSSSGKEIGSAVVRHPKSGGLILAAKPEDLAMWRRIFAAAGRSDDLLVFAPTAPLRFNFLDYEMRHGGHTRNITQCLRIMAESLRGGGARGRDQELFWEQQQERLLYNAVEVVKHATGQVSAIDLQRFIMGAATNPEQLKSEEWRQELHCQRLEAGHQAVKSPIETRDFQLAVDFWLDEYPCMADKTRSSILAGVMGTLHVFNTGLVSELVSGETNVTPDDMLRGKWVLVNMPPAEWGDLGSFVCAGWKFLTQRRVLRRKAEPTDALNIIWADEAHQFVNSFDAHYIAQCRSHLGCLVFLSQSLPGYYAAFQGDAGKYQTQSLLANFTHTIVHAVDAETAEWATKKLGKRLESFFGGSSAGHHGALDDLLGNQPFSGSFSEHYESVLQDTVFMNGLRTGGKSNGYLCDAIIIKSGETFSSGENWLYRSFKQG